MFIYFAYRNPPHHNILKYTLYKQVEPFQNLIIDMYVRALLPIDSIRLDNSFLCLLLSEQILYGRKLKEKR